MAEKRDSQRFLVNFLGASESCLPDHHLKSIYRDRPWAPCGTLLASDGGASLALRV